MGSSICSPGLNWYVPRRYSHFDKRVSEQTARALVTDPQFVVRHAFWPFLRYEKVTRRFWQYGISRSAFSPPKQKNYKKRPILYASHIDSHIYSYYNQLLSQQYEAILQRLGLCKCVLAYRKLGKSNIHFAKLAFDQVRRSGDCTVLCFDVKGFFDNLNHEYLKARWAELLGASRLPDDHYSVWRSITRHAYVHRDQVERLFPKPEAGCRLCSPKDFRIHVRDTHLVATNRDCFGIPQGSPISSTLSNIYMLEFDSVINNLALEHDGLYLRYADDIILIIPTCQAMRFKDVVQAELSKTQLQLHPDKTEEAVFLGGQIVHLEQGGVPSLRGYIQYLGFIFDGKNIRIRSGSLSRYFRTCKKAVWAAKQKADGRKAPLNKKLLFERYTHLGKRNFISYARRAAGIIGSEAIRRQVRRHFELLRREM